jgi:2'-phosphotransferase
MSDIEISKTLSYVLRHGAIEFGLEMDDCGRVRMVDLLSNSQFMRLCVTEDVITQIVDQCPKQRFKIEEIDGIKMIRANQGHNKIFKNIINEDKLLELITEPQPLCVHGTNKRALKMIRKEGLKPQNRTHIHFAIGYPDDETVLSGVRSNANVFIEIDMAKAMGDGIKFYKSANNVILSSGIDGVIPPRYFSKVL